MFLPLFLALLGPATAPACVAVEADRILAGDLAAAWPALAAIPADTALGYAPIPGVRRVLRLPELTRLAKRHGVAAPAEEICVERPMETLTPERILAAMRAAPGLAEAAIELVDYSRTAVPVGQLEFPIEGLLVRKGSPALWKGEIRYAGQRRFGVWARARIRIRRERVVAAQDLAPGQPIRPEHLRIESEDGLPQRQAEATNVDQVAGRIARRRIPTGSPVLVSLLNAPREVNRGDLVEVEVHSGAARLAVVGRAETAGRRGEWIPIKNLDSGRSFQAQVDGKQRAVVRVGQVGAVRPAGESR